MENLNVTFVGMFKSKQEDGTWKTLANYAVTSDSKQYVEDLRARGKEDSVIFFDENNPKEFIGKARFVSTRHIGETGFITRKVLEDGRVFYNVDNADEMAMELVYNSADTQTKEYMAQERAKELIANAKKLAETLRARKLGATKTPDQTVNDDLKKTF